MRLYAKMNLNIAFLIIPSSTPTPAGGGVGGESVSALVPIIAAAVSALVAAAVAWLTARIGVKTELTRLRLGTQQKLLEQIVPMRLSAYPEMYSYLSDLVKACAIRTPDFQELRALLDKVNEWDSKHSILLGPDTTNICYDFRTKLQDIVGAGAVNPTREVDREAILRHAELLELALRSDLGIYGVELAPARGHLRTPVVPDY
jgi:hypothetical protein